jgi:adenylate kinase family enzyme
LRQGRQPMKRILLTGMSGVGKSTVTRRLKAQGYQAVDLDDPGWSEWVDSTDGEGPSPLRPGKDWVWREGRVRRLLATDDAEVLFLSGCAANQDRFHGQFDYVVLLSAPAPVMVERLTNRKGSRYGTHPEEVARSLQFKETVEPRLRAVAHLEVDTSAPLDEVVAAIIKLALR